MRVPFIRPLRRCSWLPIEWAGPVEGYTLRECHVAFLLSGLPGAIRALLLDWLLDPTDLRRWPPSSSVPTRLQKADCLMVQPLVALSRRDSATGARPVCPGLLP